MSKLIDEINKYRKDFSNTVPKEIQEKIQLAIEDLEKTQLSKDALKKGDKIKNFSLPNATGKEITLDNLLSSNDFLVINFYRGAWCPYCNLELKALQDIKKELKSLNAQLVAISPQTPDSSLTTKEKNEIDFEVLSDISNKVAKEFNLSYTLPITIVNLLKDTGRDLVEFNGNDDFTLPLAATYIVNKNKEIIYSFVKEDYRAREEPQTILDIIRKNS